MPLSPILPILSFAPTSRDPFRNPAGVPALEPCLDCSMTPECSEPFCSPFNALTTQCTDQCVVVACNDPDHTEPVCDKEGQCDDIVEDCLDCNGLDAFLQCCEGYALQSERALALNTSNQAFPWDTSFNDIWCNDCSNKPSGFDDRDLDSNIPPYSSSQSVLLNKDLHHPYPSSQPETFTFNSYSLEARPVFSCMWGTCHSTFFSLSELIGHVNLHHLVGSSSPSPSSPDLQNNNLVTQASQFEQQMKSPTTCLWADCTSPRIHSFSDVDLLAYHLFNEHLGVTPSRPELVNPPPASPVSQSTISPSVSTLETIVLPTSPPCDTQSPSSQLRPTSSSSGASTPAREDEPHSCATGLHECKWRDCELFFPTCAELTTHITIAHIGGGKAKYECFWNKCTRNNANGFQSKQKICRHMQSHTGHRPFQCTICQQYFSEAATLQQHIRRHTQEKPYVCDYPGCSKSFAITGALTIHKRTHNGDKPFKCSHCNKGFAESSNLSKHLRTHTGVRPYVCTEHACGKAFARPDQLNRHKAVHQKRHRDVGFIG